MRVDVLALDGVFDLGLSAVLDVFQTANELIEMSGLRRAALRGADRGHAQDGENVARLTVPGPPCRHARARLRRACPRSDSRCPDRSRPRSRGRTSAMPALRCASGRGEARIMTAACIGTFVMAESGVLDDQRATTTWWLAPLFRQRYPSVLLDESHMLVKSGRFVTAGAALSHMDLALWLVRSVSPQLAALTAKYLIVDSQAVAVRVRADRPSRSRRPSRPALRTAGRARG